MKLISTLFFLTPHPSTYEYIGEREPCQGKNPLDMRNFFVIIIVREYGPDILFFRCRPLPSLP
jgi:hypothetical protein